MIPYGPDQGGHPAEKDVPVHWVGDAPTSLHGNGAASFERTTRDQTAVTCRLCLTLLGRNEHGVAMCSCKRYGPPHVWEPGEACSPTRVIPPVETAPERDRAAEVAAAEDRAEQAAFDAARERT